MLFYDLVTIGWVLWVDLIGNKVWDILFIELTSEVREFALVEDEVELQLEGVGCWDGVKEARKDETVVVTSVLRSARNDGAWYRCVLSTSKKETIEKWLPQTTYVEMCKSLEW